ncbi:MAG: hypothetical protein GX455_13175 [Phycisphaerae bacterium]|nr:hypothetical protein [Phycisphaerae bacterium]
MAKAKKAEEEGGESAPLWIISFADMISLLMAFFVMLSSFTSYDKSEEKKLRAAIKATLAYAGGWMGSIPLDSLGWDPGNGQKAETGAERPPIEETIQTGSIEETQASGFPDNKVFLVRKDYLFVSSGSILSPDGKQWLDAFASYVAKTSERLVIADRADESGKPFDPRPLVAVAEYLQQQRVDTAKISISSCGTLPLRNIQDGPFIEFTLLDKGVCP